MSDDSQKSGRNVGQLLSGITEEDFNFKSLKLPDKYSESIRDKSTSF